MKKNNKTKKAKCYNCIFRSDTFKIAGKTYLHCFNEDLYPKEKFESGELTAWDSLKEFWDKCDKHNFKFIQNEK